MNNKVLIPAVVVIVVIAAAAAFFVLSDDNNQEDDDFNKDVIVTNRLMICGNANSDDYLDDRDVKTIEKILTDIEAGGSWDKSANPYADANNDGKVTQADVEFVKKMVKKEPMEIFFQDTNGRILGIDYPVGNIAVLHTAAYDAMLILDVMDRVGGKHGKTPVDPIRHADFVDIPQCGKGRAIDLAMIADASSKIEGGIDAVVTRASGVDPDMEKRLAEMEDGRPHGISVIALGFGSINTEQAAYLTLGYLMQKEDNAHKYVKYLDDVTALVEDIVSKVPESKRPTVVGTGGGGNAIFSNEYEDAQWSIKAGGINNMTPELLGTGFAKYIKPGDVWQYGSEYDADWLPFTKAIDWGSDFDTYVKSFKQIEPSFKEHDCYPEHTLVMTTQIPSIVGSLYFCQVFYPDMFDKDIATEKLQVYATDFLGLKNFDVTKYPFVVTYEDVKDYI